MLGTSSCMIERSIADHLNDENKKLLCYNKCRLPTAQKALARSGCQMFESDGRVLSSKMSGINVSPDSILFTTSIEVPESVFARVAYLLK